MKNSFVVLLFLSLAAGCSTNSPTQVATPFEPGTWAGTFSSQEDYGRDGSVSQSGVITFNFTPWEYTYEARVTKLTNRTAMRCWGPGTMLRDRGTLTMLDRSAKLDDSACLRMTDVPQRSLYLHGEYSYSSYGTVMTISKIENGLTFSVTLTKQN
jgi:hypothetical protein